jgi:DNA polymerase-1
MSKVVCLIDVSGFIYRSYYAFPSLPHVKSDGSSIEVGAVFGFCSAMLRLISAFKEAMFVAAFDTSRKTFRSELYPLYKANRREMPADLVSQLPLIREACEAFGFYSKENPNYEADDIIASYVKSITNCYEYDMVIVSSDKDLLQLLRYNKGHSRIRIYDPMKRRYITGEDVLNKFGVPPEKILDVMALMGDSSDNIPGVRGIGVKSAADLINKFGDLGNLIMNLDKLPVNKKFAVLKNNIDKAILSKQLATLNEDIDIEFKFLLTKKTNISMFLDQFKFDSLKKLVS